MWGAGGLRPGPWAWAAVASGLLFPLSDLKTKILNSLGNKDARLSRIHKPSQAQKLLLSLADVS